MPGGFPRILFFESVGIVSQYFSKIPQFEKNILLSDEFPTPQTFSSSFSNHVVDVFISKKKGKVALKYIGRTIQLAKFLAKTNNLRRQNHH